MPRLSILVPVFDGARFLDETIDAVQRQTIADWELLLFDDGSRDDSRALCARRARHEPRIRCLSHDRNANRGQFATRVAAAAAARSDLIALLDQDDLWNDDYLERHLQRWDQVSDQHVQLSYGPALYFHPDEPERDYVQPMPAGSPGVFQPPDLLESFFDRSYEATPLPSCTLIRRDALRAAGRFAEDARGSQCEDQYLCWFVASRWPVAIHTDARVRYRQHSSSALSRMLASPKHALRAERRFLQVARAELTALHPSHVLLKEGRIDDRLRQLDDGRLGSTSWARLRHWADRVKRVVPVATRLRRVGRTVAARSRLALGVRPLSEAFGEDRGYPITRYYVEQFLQQHVADVRGQCLEFEGRDYVERYGADAVEQCDVLNLEPDNPAATIVADLTAPNDIPSDRYDCVIATFVLHEIFDVDAAVRELERILKPGGVLLVAVPHVTMCEPRYNERWRFTRQGLTELLGRHFDTETTTIEAYGNSLTAAAQMRGLVAEELTDAELDAHDHRFAVVICARAVKRQPEVRTEGAPPTPVRGGAKDAQGLILLYHRIAAPPQDAHLLCVSPDRFREHLDVIAQLGRPMALGEMARALRAGRLPPRAIAVTFDDGYADNLVNAKPMLERFGVPATVFVASGYVGAQREFWWDAIERLLLETPRLPQALRVRVNGHDLHWALNGAAELSDGDIARHRHWNVLDPDTPTRRHEVFRSALEQLRPMPELLRRQALAGLFAQAGASDAPRATHRVMDPGEVIELARGGLVEVGAHSVTHAQLSALSTSEQRTEIARSRVRLAELLGSPPTSFAYPFGSPADYTRETVGLVQSEGFELACSNFGGQLHVGTPRYELPRTMVMNWPAHELAARLERLFSS